MCRMAGPGALDPQLPAVSSKQVHADFPKEASAFQVAAGIRQTIQIIDGVHDGANSMAHHERRHLLMLLPVADAGGCEVHTGICLSKRLTDLGSAVWIMPPVDREGDARRRRKSLKFEGPDPTVQEFTADTLYRTPPSTTWGVAAQLT